MSEKPGKNMAIIIDNHRGGVQMSKVGTYTIMCLEENLEETAISMLMLIAVNIIYVDGKVTGRGINPCKNINPFPAVPVDKPEYSMVSDIT